MEAAMYFVGTCLIGFSAAVVWGTLVVRSTVADFRSAVAKVPEAVALAGKVVVEVDGTVRKVGEIVADARSVLPDLSDAQVADTLWKGVGEGGAKALRSFSAGLFGTEAPITESAREDLPQVRAGGNDVEGRLLKGTAN